MDCINRKKKNYSLQTEMAKRKCRCVGKREDLSNVHQEFGIHCWSVCGIFYDLGVNGNLLQHSSLLPILRNTEYFYKFVVNGCLV